MIFYERRLPHINPYGGIFFITTRLNGTLPKSLFLKWKAEKEKEIDRIRTRFKPKSIFTGKANTELGEKRKELISKVHKRFFKKIDDYLEQFSFGPNYLGEPRIAKILENKLQQYNGQHYEIIAYCIMPNHLHLLVDTSIQLKNKSINLEKDYTQIFQFMGQIKGGSAYEINKLLGRKGRIWQPESYDHLVRSPEELFNIIRYILNNPVKAGLVERWEDWPYTYVKEEFLM